MSLPPPSNSPEQPAPPTPGFSNAPVPPPPPGYQAFTPTTASYTPANPATYFGRLAGFGSRLGAWLLDGLLYGLAFAIALVPAVWFFIRSFDDCTQVTRNRTECFPGEYDTGSLFAGLALLVIGALLVGALYLRDLATTGQTWGRKIVGIKVIDEATGTPPGWGKAFGRSLFAWMISAQIIYIGYLWMLWDDKKQTLHDKVAGTHVIEAS